MFSIAFMSFGVASLSGVFVVKVLLGKVIGYLGFFIICFVFEAIGLAILWILFREVPIEATIGQVKLEDETEVDESD